MWRKSWCTHRPDADKSPHLLTSHRPAGKSYTQHRLLLGTHTSGQDQDYLQIAQVQLPKRDIDLDEFKYDEDKGGELAQSQAPSETSTRC